MSAVSIWDPEPRVIAESWEDDDPDRLASLVEAETLTPSPGLAPLDLGRLDEPAPELDWLVRGRMTRRSLTILGAKPGIGKSWLAADLTRALVTGQPWLDDEVLQPCRVLYLDVENGETLALRRLRQLGLRSSTAGDRLAYITDPLVLPTQARTLVDYARDFRPDLVVIDTLASAAPAAETDTEQASLFLSAVWHPLRDLGSAVLLLHHFRKSQQGAGRDDPLDSFRGAGHLTASVARAWVLDPLAPGKFTLRDVKPREWAARDPLRLALEDDDSTGERTTRLQVDGSEPQAEDDYDELLADVLTRIDRHPLHHIKTSEVADLGAAISLQRRTSERYLKRALTAGVLVQVTRGVYTRAVGSQDALDTDMEVAS